VIELIDDHGVMHRIDHLGRSTFVSADTAHALTILKLTRWHHNEFPEGKTAYVYRAVTHYDES
jgi:hypothetical protein